MSAGKKNRTPAELERDRRNIGRLYLQGRLQAEIGEELGIDQSTVSRDLKALQAEWRAERIMDINEAKQKELAKVDVLEVTYWQAWERSQENAEIETTKMQGANVKDAKPDRVEKQKRVEGQVGDPRFLQGVERCIERRCKILGIDAPQKVENTTREVDYSIFNVDELTRITNGESEMAVYADALKRIAASQSKG